REILHRVSYHIQELLPWRTSMLIKKTPYIEMTTMSNKEENVMLVHLVNYDVTLEGIITPAKNLQIQLYLPAGKKVKSVEYSGTLSELQSLQFEQNLKSGNNVISFNPESVDVYGLAVIRFE
ncbi:MAG: hypothetical protein JXL67_14160, partial [Calditrichaeota bacterium]|nr:hypothetical protein [Calditrichota bacterium]